MIELSQDQIDRFNEDGFLFVDNLIDDETAEEIKQHYELMFRGDFETGIRPDEINWQEGASDPSLTRQICNGWKGDRAIARVVLREDVGRACATLGGWPGARIKVDNVLWEAAGHASAGHASGLRLSRLDQPVRYDQLLDCTGRYKCGKRYHGAGARQS